MKSLVVAVASCVIFISMSGLAGAYAVQGTNGASSGTNLPQVPSGTFNINWSQLLSDLPIGTFVSNLQAAGQNIVSSAGSMTTGSNTVTLPQGDQQVLTGIDGWTIAHLGFRFSTIFLDILRFFSWIFGVAKSAVDWVINFLR